MPLAQVLGVTVTELLEGEELKNEETISAERTEQVVQKAISLSENPTARGRRFHKKNLPVWLAMTIAAVVEFLVSNHHFKWWFIISPHKGYVTARPKGRYRKHFYWSAIKRYFLNLLFSILLPALLYIFVLLHR